MKLSLVPCLPLSTGSKVDAAFGLASQFLVNEIVAVEASADQWLESSSQNTGEKVSKIRALGVVDGFQCGGWQPAIPRIGEQVVEVLDWYGYRHAELVVEVAGECKGVDE